MAAQRACSPRSAASRNLSELVCRLIVAPSCRSNRNALRERWSASGGRGPASLPVPLRDGATRRRAAGLQAITRSASGRAAATPPLAWQVEKCERSELNPAMRMLCFPGARGSGSIIRTLLPAEV